MGRLKKKDDLRTEDLGISSVHYFADPDLVDAIKVEHITRIKKMFSVRIDKDDNKFTAISSSLENNRKAIITIEKVFSYIDEYGSIEDAEIVELSKALIYKPLDNTNYRAIYTTYEGIDISPRTEAQELLIRKIQTKAIVVAHGCAGTGKSKLSVVMGLKYLKENRYDRIIIIRPMITVGASLGYLPGSVNQKYFPYASPILEALQDLVGERETDGMIKSKKIVFSPVALTRGANFQNAFIIIDEAQNLSRMEMLTLLTRIGYNTKIVVTGDESQSDRKQVSEESGLTVCIEKLEALQDVGFVKMTLKDVQRSRIVSDIIKEFEN